MEKNYYDTLIKKKIGEALRNQSPEERLDMATLESWVKADKERRKFKNRLKRAYTKVKGLIR